MKKCDIRFKVENDLTTIGAVDESNNIQDITAVTEYKNQFDKEARFFYNYKKEVFAFDGYQLKFNESNLKEFNKIQKNENNYYRTRLGDNLVTVRENLEVFVEQGLNSVENFNFKDKENKLFDKGIPFENISIEQRQALSKQNIIYPANIINKTDLPIEIKNYVNLYNQYISLNSSNRANFATNRSVINENTVLYLDSANKLNYIMAASDLASLEESEVHGNNYLSIALAQRGEQEDVNISESVSDNPVWEQGDNVFNQEEYNNQVNYRLKVVNSLLKLATPQEDKRTRKYGEINQPEKLTIRLNTKERPYLESNIRKTLAKKGVPANQIDFVFEYMRSNNIKEISTEELALRIATNYSYTVEINTATKNEIGVKESYNPETGEVDIDNIEPDFDYIEEYDDDGNIIDMKPVLSEKGKKQLEEQPIQLHSNLTVNEDFYKNNPDWEYRIQQIVTPNITPSIQNHYFGSKEDNNKIGWFRAWYNKKTGEVHILEIQSDLFQRGREYKKLTGQDERIGDTLDDLLGTTGKKEFDSIGNQFLQLLNKDNNWVTFFIKSIIQDSAKKGYEKVLFPKGETAAKIEGHETIADRLRQINEDLDRIERTKNNAISPFLTEQDRLDKVNSLEKERQELKSQGIEKLKPIEAFYEIKVGNILEKQFGKDNVKTITDEYGNQWREITINQARDLQNINSSVSDDIDFNRESNKSNISNIKPKDGVSELFESNPELANSVYEALGFDTINESEITYTDEEGNLCAKMGGRSSKFTKGSKWEIVKDLKGYPSHAQGGVDIKLGKNGFSFTRNNGVIEAKHGLVLPDWDKVKSTLNPKNWGVPDYTDKGSKSAAYAAARQAGEKEFMWNNKRFNTNYDGTPQQQLKETGITDERLQGKSEIRKRIVNNIVPQGYGHIGSAVKAIITNTPEMPVPDKEVKYLIPTKKESTRYREEAIDPTKGGRILPRDLWDESKGKAHYDALSLTMGFPQKYNSFGVSSYKPSISKENNTIYYKLTNDTTINNILQRALEPGSTYQVGDLICKTTTLPIGGSKQLEAESAYNPNITESEGSLGTYTVSRGEDDRGEYISYYDINDYSPFGSYMPGKGGGKNAINSPFGKSFEIYDRIYIKDYGDGQKKRMYYTDKELSELDVNKKNFDALALQRELSNRGYKLPESTKQDGSFDGIWGDETKNALIDWQNKMRPKPIVDKATGLDKYSKNQY